MKRLKVAVIGSLGLMTLTLLAGCFDNPDERFDVGYDDGYAVGYNTECKVRTTLIEGDFDNVDYSRGYNAGLNDGIQACQSNQ